MTDLSMRNTSDLALHEINSAQHGDARIKFLLEDDRSTVDGAIEAYNKLISQNSVSAILGPTTSSATKEVFPIAQSHKTVAISQTSAAQGLSAIGDFVFRASLMVDKLVPNGIQITQQRPGYERVATIADAVDLFSQSSQAVLVDSLNANDVEVLAAETFETGETDFTEQLTRIKESNPDAIFISGLSPEITAILIQGRQLGIPVDVPFIVTVTLTSEQIQLRAMPLGAPFRSRVGSILPTPRAIKPLFKTTGINIGCNRIYSRRKRMPPFIFWLKRLRKPDQPIRRQSGTSWLKSEISTLF